MTDRKRKPFKAIAIFSVIYTFLFEVFSYDYLFIYIFFQGVAWRGAGESMVRTVKSMLLKVKDNLWESSLFFQHVGSRIQLRYSDLATSTFPY